MESQHRNSNKVVPDPFFLSEYKRRKSGLATRDYRHSNVTTAKVKLQYSIKLWEIAAPTAFWQKNVGRLDAMHRKSDSKEIVDS